MAVQGFQLGRRAQELAQSEQQPLWASSTWDDSVLHGEQRRSLRPSSSLRSGALADTPDKGDCAEPAAAANPAAETSEAANTARRGKRWNFMMRTFQKKQGSGWHPKARPNEQARQSGQHHASAKPFAIQRARSRMSPAMPGKRGPKSVKARQAARVVLGTCQKPVHPGGQERCTITVHRKQLAPRNMPDWASSWTTGSIWGLAVAKT